MEAALGSGWTRLPNQHAESEWARKARYIRR